MYTIENQIAVEKIKKIIKADSPDSRIQIVRILLNDLKNIKLGQSTNIIYCGCGFPVSVKSGSKRILLDELLDTEAVFRSYKIYYYCPLCNVLIDEIQC